MVPILQGCYEDEIKIIHHLTLFIQGFYIADSPPLAKVICNPKLALACPFAVTEGVCRAVKSCSPNIHVGLGRSETVLCLLIPARTANKRHSHGLLTATFFTHLCLLLVISLFKIDPKPRAEVLSNVFSTRKLMKEKCVLEKLRSG